MANIKPKRIRPKSKADRARLCEINTRLNRSRLPDHERAALEAERDRLSPIKGPARPKYGVSSDDLVPESAVWNQAEGCFVYTVKYDEGGTGDFYFCPEPPRPAAVPASAVWLSEGSCPEWEWTAEDGHTYFMSEGDAAPTQVIEDTPPQTEHALPAATPGVPTYAWVRISETAAPPKSASDAQRIEKECERRLPESATQPKQKTPEELRADELIEKYRRSRAAFPHLFPSTPPAAPRPVDCANLPWSWEEMKAMGLDK